MFKIVTIALISMLYINSVYSSENVQTRELLAFFKDIHSNTPLDSPERMLVNRSDGNRYYLALEILKGRLKATNKQRLVAQKKLNKLREQILIGRNWPIKKRQDIQDLTTYLIRLMLISNIYMTCLFVVFSGLPVPRLI